MDRRGTLFGLRAGARGEGLMRIHPSGRAAPRRTVSTRIRREIAEDGLGRKEEVVHRGPAGYHMPLRHHAWAISRVYEKRRT